MNAESEEVFRCGYIGIVGRPNVGKSTLLNNILGMKVSITSRKPQTTRHQILGISTTKNSQSIYVDTPGIHKDKGAAINRYMNRAATSVLNDVDVVIFVIQALKWNDDDESVLGMLNNLNTPVIFAINKIDLLKDKKLLLPFIEKLSGKMSGHEIIPLSATKGIGIEQLVEKVQSFLPSAPPVFSDDMVTDRNMRFLASEIIREKLVRDLGQELPYVSAVVIDKYVDEKDLIRIHAVIYVESKGQKSIIIGKKGERLKQIGSKARQDIERLTGNKVYLNLWIKVKEGWSNDDNLLQSMGYAQD